MSNILLFKRGMKVWQQWACDQWRTLASVVEQCKREDGVTPAEAGRRIYSFRKAHRFSEDVRSRS